MKSQSKILLLAGCCALLVLAVLLSGCSDNEIAAPSENPTNARHLTIEEEFEQAADKGMDIIWQDGSLVPAEIAHVSTGGADISFWPYTATSLTDSPMDPVNLVFKGAADPLQIREALMSLDGNRTDAFPDMPPFNLPWTDALGGDVQTTYINEEGWEGCVIQLTLGEYSGLRVHLRLFATDLDDGQGGTYSLGGAHFEMMIPGTSEHQVLSWEWAEGIVMYDLARSGLLAAAPVPTGMINAAPSFRSIPTFIYNPMVDDAMGQMLLGALGYPIEHQSAAFPLPSDGQGTLLYLGGALPITPVSHSYSVVIEYNQAIPRPVCSDGPYDWLYVTGPITFTTNVVVSNQGRYDYDTVYDGTLNAVPIDIETFQPIGAPFLAEVSGRQEGKHKGAIRKVRSQDRRLALQENNPELFFDILQVGTIGTLGYKAFEKCFENPLATN